ncbi:MAG: DUF5713 family protein [Chloroflexi bacterium]|nr:DUF5713 family protein [Chloroflexota bacterium]
MTITNPKLQNYPFLQTMYRDSYYPDFLVDKCKQILIGLCEQIEAQRPTTDADVYKLTHAATLAINDVGEEFNEHGSDLETIARDCLATDFEFIVQSYGFELDLEEVVAPREW